MDKDAARVELGVILCKYCHTVIGTFDAEKVTTYYSDCQEQDCYEVRLRREADAQC
ncbi:GapA-binding peptide SR1P [Paenibacillus silviterrae]|uniref:GapA-binding peptide SR1P n=1 Tax=Paenibacillus silviterrae TaxID=3242194 RepID=UPI002543D9CD|nr:GapA-binding peptide SR1P [Paenibacillus chinjuensis]